MVRETTGLTVLLSYDLGIRHTLLLVLADFLPRVLGIGSDEGTLPLLGRDPHVRIIRSSIGGASDVHQRDPQFRFGARFHRPAPRGKNLSLGGSGGVRARYKNPSEASESPRLWHKKMSIQPLPVVGSFSSSISSSAMLRYMPQG
mmetsp:Transcript_22894/g.67587  ORF Transcript_22894/g.67587 Transcript_22894/m.67587 type:complete len:145 (-) Transcript_22894:613-1047(-)